MRLLALIVVWTMVPALAGAAEPAGLARARVLYNAANYDAAIAAADPVRQQPQWADAAALVIARSYLERFRQHAAAVDLTAGIAMLSTVRAASLAPRDQLDLLIGLGQSLYLGERFGAAAEVFDNTLSGPAALAARDRVLLLEWWAAALEREAQSRPADRRPAVFTRIAERMESELRSDPGSRVANYWLAASARGAGDSERAWDAAVAAWVRAGLSADPGGLRADIDRLVTTALIPERLRLRPTREQANALAEFRTEWEAVKQEWK